MKRSDRPLIPQECRRRPHVDAFADFTPIDESTLIDKSQLLDPTADNDDIDWKIVPFEMHPDSANPKCIPKCFGLLDFRAGYHQIPLDPESRKLTASEWLVVSANGTELPWD